MDVAFALWYATWSSEHGASIPIPDYLMLGFVFPSELEGCEVTIMKLMKRAIRAREMPVFSVL